MIFSDNQNIIKNTEKYMVESVWARPFFKAIKKSFWPKIDIFNSIQCAGTVYNIMKYKGHRKVQNIPS